MKLMKFKLLETFRKIKPFSITFKDELTVIVGENCSGKSSFFTLLTDPSHKKIIEIKHTPEISYRFFDTEKQNPRIKNSMSDSKNIMFDIATRFSSHGEAMLPILLGTKQFNNELILIDEPDAGISLKNQKKMLDAFKMAINNDCQIIMSTHSYFLIKNVQSVFNMSTKNGNHLNLI